MLVAESGLPGHYDVVGEIQGHGNRVRHFAAIFFRKYPAGHVSGGWQGQVEGAHDPRDLMNHILGHVAAGEFPEEAPVEQAIRIEGSVGAAVQEGAPVDVLGGAVGGNGTNPLALSVRSVATHPGFYLRDLAYHSVFDPLSCVL